MRLELTRFSLIRTLLKSRWPQFLVTTLMLAGFSAAILAGLTGTPVGNHNFSTVFVWIAWWAILMLVAVPFFGRGWCAICPIPIPGEWLQRRNILEPGSRQDAQSRSVRKKRGDNTKISANSALSAVNLPHSFSLNRRWPNRLRNIWLQNGMFILMALFSAVILTTPAVTAIVLAAFLFIAIGTSLVFERRAFCRYLCPVGGFIGLYAQIAPLALRVKSAAACATCSDKPCYNGSAAGYGCPWQVFPGGLAKNTYCGLCMECLRTCPKENIAVNLRPFAADLFEPRGRRLDEAFKAFIMLGAAMVYSGVLLGPWGALKSAAYYIGTLPWVGYAIAFLVINFILLPSAFSLLVLTGKILAQSTSPLRQSFTAYAYTLVPLGLTAWIAFSLSFVFTNTSYILSTISDPFGWGWNLFGTVGFPWTPVLTAALPALQILVLVGGLLWSARTAQKIAAESLPPDTATRAALPVILFCLLVTLALMGLLL